MPVMIIGGELFCHSEGDEGVLCGALERTQREGIPPWRVPGVGLCLLSAEGRVTPLAALLKRPPPGCVTRYGNGDIKDLRQENLLWFRPTRAMHPMLPTVIPWLFNLLDTGKPGGPAAPGFADEHGKLSQE